MLGWTWVDWYVDRGAAQDIRGVEVDERLRRPKDEGWTCRLHPSGNLLALATSSEERHENGQAQGQSRYRSPTLNDSIPQHVAAPVLSAVKA